MHGGLFDLITSDMYGRNYRMIPTIFKSPKKHWKTRRLDRKANTTNVNSERDEIVKRLFKKASKERNFTMMEKMIRENYKICKIQDYETRYIMYRRLKNLPLTETEPLASTYLDMTQNETKKFDDRLQIETTKELNVWLPDVLSLIVINYQN